MKIEAELKETYKIILGDDGMCMGQYFSEDDWKESYYGDTIEDIVKKINNIYFNGFPKTFDLEKWKVLVYDDNIYDYNIISEYQYYNDDNTLKKEKELFFNLWHNDYYSNIRKNMIEAKKIKDEREEKLIKMKKEEEKKKKELENYLKLKEKYENK